MFPRPRIPLGVAIRFAVLSSGIALGYLFCPRELPAAPDVALPDQPGVQDPSPLDRQMGTVMLHDATLSDIVQLIRERTGANVFVKPSAENGSPQVPGFEAEISNPTLGEFIRAMSFWDPALKCEHRNGALVVSRSSEPPLIRGGSGLRVYLISDLLENRLLWREFLDGRQPGAADAAQGREDSLLRQISTTVAPDTWRDSGGVVGSMRIANGQLIVTQSPAAQVQIADLLEVLRRIADQLPNN
jgi:hypothetical protein